MGKEEKNIQTATDKTFDLWWTHFLTQIWISDEEWEKDLAAEIQDFEVVDDQNVDESDLDFDLKWTTWYAYETFFPFHVSNILLLNLNIYW